MRVWRQSIPVTGRVICESEGVDEDVAGSGCGRMVVVEYNVVGSIT